MEKAKHIETFYGNDIPEGWHLKKLKDILVEGRLGGNYENAEANTGIPVIKMGNLDRGNIKIDKVQFLPENETYDKEDVLVNGDLLFNTRNTLELVGKVAIWNNELPFAVYNSNLMRMKFDSAFVESNSFMNCAFNSNYGLRQLRGIATGTTSVAAIYGRDLETIKFLLPPLPEQKAIAQVLSTADTAIHTTEKLIAQKELRKKWLMQNLLTGKKRLLNDELGMMNDELGKVKFGSFANIKKGKALTSSELIDGNIPVIAGGQTSPYKHNAFTHENVITISASGAYAGFVAYHNGKIWASDCSVVEGIKGKSSTLYLFYVLQFNQGKIYKLQTGGAQPHVYPDDIHNLSLIIHHSLKEQTAIAQVLQAADKEISLLKAKAEKLRGQKKGLMQVLLTGKVRLKINDI